MKPTPPAGTPSFMNGPRDIPPVAAGAKRQTLADDTGEVVGSSPAAPTSGKREKPQVKPHTWWPATEPEMTLQNRLDIDEALGWDGSVTCPRMAGTDNGR
jgi:hypothetical protein